MDTSERLLMLEFHNRNNKAFSIRIMGLLQDAITRIAMLFVSFLARYGQPYLFKMLLSPQFFPTPEQIGELLHLHPGATVLNIEKTLDPRNALGEVAQLSGGLVKVPTVPPGLEPKALEGELGQLGGLTKVSTSLSGLPLPMGIPAGATDGMTGALSGLPGVSGLPGGTPAGLGVPPWSQRCNNTCQHRIARSPLRWTTARRQRSRSPSDPPAPRNPPPGRLQTPRLHPRSQAHPRRSRPACKPDGRRVRRQPHRPNPARSPFPASNPVGVPFQTTHRDRLQQRAHPAWTSSWARPSPPLQRPPARLQPALQRGLRCCRPPS